MNKKAKMYGASVLVIVMLVAVMGFGMQFGLEAPTGAIGFESEGVVEENKDSTWSLTGAISAAQRRAQRFREQMRQRMRERQRKRMQERTQKLRERMRERARERARDRRGKEKTPTEKGSCKDPDGKNYLKASTTTTKVGSRDISRKDECMPDGRLKERICNTAGKMSVQYIDCKTIGKTKCSDGACV